MSVWQHTLASFPGLEGVEGELISVRVSTSPRALEDLLECLSTLSFPINPQILHGIPTTVEFPAWTDKLSEIREALSESGFDPNSIDVQTMLAAITPQ